MAAVRNALSGRAVDRLRKKTGYNPRQRKATAHRLLVIVVSACLLGYSLRFAVLRALFERRFGSIRSRAFQLRFKSVKAAAFFRGVLDDLIQRVIAAVDLHLDGPLKSFDDVLVYDATCQRVPPRGRKLLPATTPGRAGAKWLPGYSLKSGLITGVTHGADTAGELPMWRQLVGKMTKNVLYLMDLAYFDGDLFEEARRTEAHLLLRLKSKVKVWVTGYLTPDGMKPASCIALSTFLSRARTTKGTLYDLDVSWSRKKKSIQLRLVGFSRGGGRVRWLLTTVPRSRLSAADVVTAYRLRWLIEFLFRELKQNADIGRSATADPNALAALTYGALIAHVVVRSLRITAALHHGVPVTELRPLACANVTLAYANEIADALLARCRTRWSQVVATISEHLVSFAREVRPSRSRERISLLLGAVGA